MVALLLNSVAKIENAQAAEAATRVYLDSIKKHASQLPMDDEKLQQAHKLSLDLAMETFKTKAYDEGDEKRSARKKFTDACESHYKTIVERNYNTSAQQCEQLLQELARPLQTKLRNKQYQTMQALVDEWLAMTRTYLNKASGSFKQVLDRLINFEQQNFGPMLVALSSHFADEANQALAAQKQKEIELGQKIVDARKEVEKAIQNASKHEVEAAKFKEKTEAYAVRVKHLETERADIEKKVKAIEQQLHERSGELQRLIIEKKDSDSTLAITREKLDALHKSSEAEIKRLAEEKTALEASMKDFKLKHSQQKEHFSQSVSSFKSENQQLKESLAVLNAQLTEAKSSQQSLSRSKDETEKEIEKLRALVKRLEDDLTMEKNTNKKLSQDASSFRSSSEITKKSLSDIENEKKKLETTVSEQRKEITSLNRDFDSVKKELADVKNSLAESAKTNDMMLHQHHKLNKTVQELQEQVDSKESDNAKLAKKYEELSAKYEAQQRDFADRLRQLEEERDSAVAKAAESKKTMSAEPAAAPASPRKGGRVAKKAAAAPVAVEKEEEPEPVSEPPAAYGNDDDDVSSDNKENEYVPASGVAVPLRYIHTHEPTAFVWT
jgi:chromosome segregation ATPase